MRQLVNLADRAASHRPLAAGAAAAALCTASLVAFIGRAKDHHGWALELVRAGDGRSR
ncbi:hypothetical protein WB401_36230 [Streptomyces brasiliscabiei]|uniref:Uncharacterized protein n=1 Tax=Streptomyces brasiliscabiei TaxID=2736302 RepID=A0ABU8GN98_9ACTN